jgi:hypothetical protein
MRSELAPLSKRVAIRSLRGADRSCKDCWALIIRLSNT